LRVKICGITNVADALLAASLGADAIGLNFYPDSPRNVTLAVAQDILRALPPFVEPVGLFVNETVPEVAEKLRSLRGIHTVQWHGNQRALLAEVPFRAIPVFPVHSEADLERITQHVTEANPRYGLPPALLVDARVPGLHGGTGTTIPWHLLGDFRPGVPLILAGGLTADNVAEAIRLVQPYAVDVASGVEKSRGVKDADKLRRFMDRVRGAQ
jgi:phosphoribosylanthranilate isomerase